MTRRMDNWSGAEDQYVAEIVLEHIRSGKTQTKAFEKAGEHLENRSVAAIGFRWNNKLKNEYIQMVEEAKKVRLQWMKTHGKEEEEEMPREQRAVVQELKPRAVIKEMPQEEVKQKREYEDMLENLQTIFFRMASLESENQALKSENKELHERMSGIHQEYQSMQEDYEVLRDIMSRARKMIQLEENGALSNLPAHRFKMDKNGNLERIAN